MKNKFSSFLVAAVCFFSLPAFSQTEKDTALLGLPGDNLDLYAVLDLFQKSKTIEEFEKSLNLEKTKINNLDLDLDKKVDFIKVVTKQKDNDFTFILQVAVTEKETQDVAVILVSKDKKDKVTLQIVGDKDLYGKDYVIEPKPAAAPASTANPGYSGAEPVVVTVPATTTVVVVESAPIVQYVYSPVYVPYYPPYHYAYYPPYYSSVVVVSTNVYYSNHYNYYHGGYHGGYNNTTVVVHNTNNYNNYNGTRNSSNTVNHNNANGNYNGNKATTNPSKGTSSSKNPSATPSTNQSKGSAATKNPSAAPSTTPSKGTSSTKSPSAAPSTTPSNGTSSTKSPSAAPSTNPSQSPSAKPPSTNQSRPSSTPASGGSRGSGGGRRR